MPSATEDLEFDDDQEQILHALHFAVGNICSRVEEEDEEEKDDEDDSDDGNNKDRGKKILMSKSSIRTLTQMTYHYATKCLAKDLAAFSKHANRKTITVDDVKLIARKNPRGLMDTIEGLCEHSSSGANIRERKRNHFMVTTNSKNDTRSNKRPLENKSINGTRTEDASISGESSTDSLLQGERVWRRQDSSSESSQQLQIEWNIADISNSSSSSSSNSIGSSDELNGQKESKNATLEGNVNHDRLKASKPLSGEVAIELVDSESD
mmetsp:Transcript_8448/g.15934  ORF Transcript_8448/g.15934 Transcript_8448/m.15934 type:complete len:266 (-) Transcript_8448:13-810(-)